MRLARALLVAAVGTLATGAAAQPALKSDFFRDDPTAIAIAAGAITRNINDVGLVAGVSQGDSTTFAYRVASAYRQVGYSYPFNVGEGETTPERVQNRFQIDQQLPVRSLIDSNLLLRLDELLAAREATDRTRGPAFPLFSRIAPPPDNEPPAIHLAAIWGTVFSALPAALSPWTEANFKLYFLTQRLGSILLDSSGGGYRLCDGFYYFELGDSCTYLGPNVWLWNDDFSEADVSLHEYAHFLDRSVYSSSQGTTSAIGSVETIGFTEIGYDTADTFDADGWTFYRPRSTDPADRISGYALGWSFDPTPGYFTAYEDFAESFTAYVLQGFVFRDLARSRPLLAARYEWLKSRVFGAVEYDTGNRNYLALFPLGNRPAVVNDYSRADPSFVWSQSIPVLVARPPLTFVPVTPRRNPRR
jgi:hypothetical protein